jgi:hypothetical protein
MELGRCFLATLSLIALSPLVESCPPMNVFSPIRAIALAIGLSSIASAQVMPCAGDAPCRVVYYQREPAQPSWIFAPSTYTHDPLTGARVAQYMRTPPVEPLDDPRWVTSRYRRVRTNLRGPDGSQDSTYDVQNVSNGHGGLDAEWERFHDAWKESYLTGGFYNQNSGFNGFPNFGFGNGFPQNGFGFPNNFPNKFPNHGFGGPGPSHGFPPWNGMPSQGGPPHGGAWNGQGPHGQGPGNGQHGNDHHDGGKHDGPKGGGHGQKD